MRTGVRPRMVPARSVSTRLPSTGCGWCGAPLDRGAGRRSRRTRCRACGAWTTDPVPGPAELAAAYDHWYRPPAGRFSGPGDALLRATRGRLAGRLDRIAPPGPILDVGSGDGALLDALRRRGREAVGLERGAQRADTRELEISEVEGRWAGIVFWHSLEHLPGAGAALGHAASLLERRGVVVIAMPNAASLQAAAFGDGWLALDIPRHLVHVPAPALFARLEGEGLRVERVSFARGGQVVFGWLHGLVGRLPGHPDLYDAIRRPEARRTSLSAPARAGALVAAVILLPVAAACAALETAARRGGTTYVEARHV